MVMLIGLIARYTAQVILLILLLSSPKITEKNQKKTRWRKKKLAAKKLEVSGKLIKPILHLV